MKSIENYLNILHFCFYKADSKLHLLFNKVNLLRLLLKIPYIKKRLEKKGITDFQKEYDKAFLDKNSGLSMVFAGGILWGIVAVFFFTLLILFNLIVYAGTPIIISCSILSGVVCYFFVFRNDMYIQYFDKYEKWSKAEKRKFSWLTFASIVAVFLLFYLGLKT